MYQGPFSVSCSKEARLCLANHRAGYFSNLACDWLIIVWAFSEQETENGPWTSSAFCVGEFQFIVGSYSWYFYRSSEATDSPLDSLNDMQFVFMSGPWKCLAHWGQLGVRDGSQATELITLVEASLTTRD